MIYEGDHVSADPVKGLVMMSEAKQAADPKEYDWIATMQEEAFALATPKQRLDAIELLAKQ